MKSTPHTSSSESSALPLGVGQTIEALARSASGSNFIPQSITTFDVPPDALNLYSILQLEVDIGVQALERESADMAVTFFQSALQKMTVDQPLYDHLVHNLLLSYKLLIEQLLNNQDTAMALEFLRAALRLEIRGNMTDDNSFLGKFAGVFQNLAVVFFQNGLCEAVSCVVEEQSPFVPAPALM